MSKSSSSLLGDWIDYRKTGKLDIQRGIEFDRVVRATGPAVIDSVEARKTLELAELMPVEQQESSEFQILIRDPVPGIGEKINRPSFHEVDSKTTFLNTSFVAFAASICLIASLVGILIWSNQISSSGGTTVANKDPNPPLQSYQFVDFEIGKPKMRSAEGSIGPRPLFKKTGNLVEWQPDGKRTSVSATMNLLVGSLPSSTSVWVIFYKVTDDTSELVRINSYDYADLVTKTDQTGSQYISVPLPTVTLNSSKRSKYVAIALANSPQPEENFQTIEFDPSNQNQVTDWLTKQQIHHAALTTIVFSPKESNDVEIEPGTTYKPNLDSFGESIEVQFDAILANKQKIVLSLAMSDGSAAKVVVMLRDRKIVLLHTEEDQFTQSESEILVSESVNISIRYHSHYGLGLVELMVNTPGQKNPLVSRRYNGNTFPNPKTLEISSSHPTKLKRLRLSGEEKLEAYANNDPRIKKLRVLEQQVETLTENDQLKEANELGDKGVHLANEIFGIGTIESTWLTNQLAMIARRRGNTESSNQYFESTIQISDVVLGEMHPDTAITRSNYGLFLSKQGKLRKANSLLKKAITDFAQSCSEKDPSLYTLKNNYATVLSRLGNWSEVYRIYDEILKAREAERPKSPAAIATANNNMGYVLTTNNMSTAAIPFFEKALSIREKIYANRPIHENLIRSRQNLATAKYRSGNKDEGLKEWQTVLKLWKMRSKANEISGSKDELIVTKQLATAYLENGDVKAAEPLVKSAKEIVAVSLSSNREQSASVELLVGLWNCQSGQLNKGLQHLINSINIYQELFDESYPFLAAQERQALLKFRRVAIDYLLTYWNFENGTSEELYPIISQWKNSLRNRHVSMLQLRDDAQAKQLFEKLQGLSRSIAQQLNQPGDALKNARRDKLEIERKLSGMHLVATTEYVDPIHQLADDHIVLDFFEYYDHSNRPAIDFDPHILVFVLSKKNGIKAIPLGRSKSIARAIKKWIKSILEDELDEVFRNGNPIREMVWNPIQEFVLPNARLTIFRDGPINSLPFAALNLDDQFLLEKHRLVFAESSGDIVAKSETPFQLKSALLVGGFDYPNNPLPMAKSEISRIGKLLRSTDSTVQELHADSAHKEFLKELSTGYSLQHFACHAESQDSTLDSVVTKESNFVLDEGSYQDPLNKVCIVLPKRRIYGSQIAVCDLRNVGLSVLSACGSSKGGSQYGDMVTSLASSFRLGGCRAVIGSQWMVEDMTGNDMMADFYKQMIQNQLSPSEALRKAQLKTLSNSETRHPFFWANWSFHGPAE